MGDRLGSIPAACERGRTMPKRLVVIYGLNQRSLKSFLVTVLAQEGVMALQMVLEPTCDYELRQWIVKPCAVTWHEKDTGKDR